MRFVYNGVFILVTFILGYLMGIVGLETFLRMLLLKMSDLDFIEIIGFSSSLISLILFLAYIIGRIILIKKMEVTLNETIELSYENENQKFTVSEEYNLGELNSEFVYLTSTEPLRWIRFYESNSNNESNKVS
ncbi:hypothetical protein ACFFIX_22960 [Metabacillus herbersteinensis]|uniref:Poly-beta-1,6-N-acetyl-D-glucosamine biosynthesis protein PgaD n=1 Tax=Metabacillus herbersteinensis TaxID=283816 RepID=A0ABV6GL62_9BACI